MKKFLSGLFALISAVVLFGTYGKTALAGSRTIASLVSNDNQTINEADWEKTDEAVIYKDGKLQILADQSTQATKIISKTVARKDEGTDKIISVSSELCLTELPQGQKFVLVLGLQSIEGSLGQTGNVEISFEQNQGLEVSVLAYNGDQPETVVQNKKCSFSLGTKVSFVASISAAGVLDVKLNGSTVCNASLPVSGEGRFGILQTGGCGAEVSNLCVTCNYYDRPENSNIEEDFEKGEWNANLLMANAIVHGYAGRTSMQIEDYNGSKVLMTRYNGVGYFGTVQEYSNFELSFDIPYFLRENVYDEQGNVLMTPADNVAIAFGEDTFESLGSGYTTATDLVCFGRNFINTVKGKYTVYYTDLDFALFNPDNNEGFSVKLSVIDGHSELFVKPLKGSTWTKIAETQYDSYYGGYVRIWNTGMSNIAIDNFKLINKDTQPNLVEVEYQSSVIPAEDYVLTEEDEAMVFREEETGNESEEQEETETFQRVWIIWGVTGIVVLAAVVTVLFIMIRKRNNRKNGGKSDEKKDVQ